MLLAFESHVETDTMWVKFFCTSVVIFERIFSIVDFFFVRRVFAFSLVDEEERIKAEIMWVPIKTQLEIISYTGL